MPLISAIINNFNYGRYIDEAIASIMNQTFPQNEIEIVVVDDGSTDDSRRRLEKYGEKIRRVFKENGGQASAFNAGVEVAGGKIVAFLDSDDFWHPDKLRTLAEEFEKDGSTDFVYHYMNVVDDGHNVIDRFLYPAPSCGAEDRTGKRGYLDCYLEGRLPWFSPSSGMAVRSECLKRSLPVPEDFRIAADIYLHYVLPFYCRKIVLLKKPLGYYRVHGENLSGGVELSSGRISRETGYLLRIKEEVGKHSCKLGLDSECIMKRIDELIGVYGILGDNVGGRKIKALKKAILMKSSLPGESLPARLIKKTTRVVQAVIPPSFYLWLQKKYRSVSFVLSRKG